MPDPSFTLQLTPDQEITPAGEAAERILEIALQAPQLPGAAQRTPLNLAMVLDRSGSMSGKKLEYVKQAAAHILDFLQDLDRAALVDYDDEVRLLAPAAAVSAAKRSEMKAILRRIQAGGYTNLSGGWLTGCQEIASAPEGMLNRTLLLTDGLANVGITDPEELAVHARELAARGVTTSTFGVGEGFNQELLEVMANQGEGHFYFIETPEDIPGIFEREFKEIAAVFARSLEIHITYPAAIGVEVPGGWRSECPQPGQMRIYGGVLPAGQSREFYCKLSIPAGLALQEIQLQVKVLGRAKGGALLEVEATATIRSGTKEVAEACAKNKTVLERFSKVELADKAAAALKLEREGLREEARAAMAGPLLRYQANISPSMAQDYQDMTDRMAAGMTEQDRKRSHMHSYAQKQRRESNRFFPLVPGAKGHLVIDVDGHTALLDTGSPVSIGRRDSLAFMGRQFPLQPEYLGVTPEYLSDKLGLPIDFLLGMDVLGELTLQIDTRRGMVFINDEAALRQSNVLPVERFMNIPVVEMTAAGRPCKAFLDTSAKLSYFRKEALAGLQSIDTEVAFYPGIGDFETPVYAVPVKVGNQTLTLRCGELPLLLEQTLAASGVEGILGAELYDQRWAMLDLISGKLRLEKFPRP